MEEIDKKIKTGIKKGIESSIKSKITDCKLKTDTDLFDFIEEKKLRKALKKSYRELIFINNLVSTFQINYKVAHPFNEIVVLHNASIYEALLDHILEKYFKEKIKDLLKPTVLKKRDNGQFSITDNADASKLYLCKEVKNDRKLYSVKFEDRVNRAVELGILDSSILGEIKALYTQRNNIHILKASTNGAEFTKKIVADYCKVDSLRSFCNKIKDQIQINTNE